jgi:hypothetical protein
MNQYSFLELARSAGYVGFDRETVIKKIEIYKVEEVHKFEKLIEPRLLIFTLSDETRFALGWDIARDIAAALFCCSTYKNLNYFILFKSEDNTIGN